MFTPEITESILCKIYYYAEQRRLVDFVVLFRKNKVTGIYICITGTYKKHLPSF